ncbi:CGNR zinc finger domain-containing protein [Streptomyces sp. HK10]|uniref:CGNR zinc finger domain-containing protein n=1 Tax=Streptomyces sp. HK10 TaxID=3373255 RepID=UPI00374806DD
MHPPALDPGLPARQPCEAHDCRLAYCDRSRAGRRRRCTMAVCGSGAKTRTRRARRSSAE